MNGDELKKILCLLEPGMTLTVPDSWIGRILSGPLAKQVAWVNEIALSYGCCVQQGVGTQTFEKMDIPATG